MTATYLIAHKLTEHGNPIEYYLEKVQHKDMRTYFCKRYKDDEITDIPRLVKAIYDYNVRVKESEFVEGRIRLILPDGKTAWEFKKAIHGIWKGGKR